MTLVSLLLLASVSFAQFTSPYLLDPELNIGYVDSCANFWLQTWDDGVGGFYTNVDRDGSILTNWGTNKNMITQSRNAYGLVRAYQMTGDMTYLTTARDALDWMQIHAWDPTYGGYYNDISEQGNPINPTADKTAFYQHYALLGLAAYVEATRDTTMYNRLLEGYAWMEEHMWDSREGYEGYYDRVSYTGSDPNGKSFNATVDAITTHVLLLQLMGYDWQYMTRLEQLAEQIQIHLIASMAGQAIGFAEVYTSDWEIDPSETMTIMGHVLKSAWCLGRVYRLNHDSSLLESASALFYDVWDNGYDHDFGGPYKDYNRVTGDMLLWGNPDTTKAWWQVEQAVMAGLQLAHYVPNNDAAEMANQSMDFFMTHFVDREYGEIYADRTRYGGFAWNEAKGSGGKAGYHSIETGYYSYLYASFLLGGEDVTLYYKVEPLDEQQVVTLIPIASIGTLLISEVTLNGEEFFNFESEYVVLAAGEGGQLEVTYVPLPDEVREIISIKPVTGFELVSTYPNPFNGSTTLSFILQQMGSVSVDIFNINGQLMQSTPAKRYPVGTHSIPLLLTDVASGQYVVVARTPYDVQTTRITLVR
jgi:mannose/cellobiose epimerase-like protein (N-acyl-D-glucosamine 2-epimerase family)